MRLFIGLFFVILGGYLALTGLEFTDTVKLQGRRPYDFPFGMGIVMWGLAICVPGHRYHKPATNTRIYTLLPTEGLWMVFSGWLLTIGLCFFIVPFAINFEGYGHDLYADIWINIQLHPWIELIIASISAMALLTLSLLRYGRIPLHVHSASARAGETLDTFLKFKQRGAVKTINAELKCYKLQVLRNSKNKRYLSRTVLWSFTSTDLGVSPGGRVDIRFAIPVDLPGATTNHMADELMLEPGCDYYAWVVQITSEVWGVDLRRTYDIPVETALPGAREAMARASAQIEADMEAQAAQEAAEQAQVEAQAAQEAVEKARAVRTVALSELAAGKSFDAVTDKLTGMGIAADIIISGLKSIATETASPYAAGARAWLAHQQKLQAEIDAGQVMILTPPEKPRTSKQVEHIEEDEQPGIFDNVIKYVIGTLLLLVGIPVIMHVGPVLLGLNKDEDLIRAIQDHQLSKVQALLKDGADPNAKDKAGQAALAHAAWNDRQSIKPLLNAGANPNVNDISGNPLLLHFASAGDVEMVELLLRLGADVNSRGANDVSPLHTAVQTTPEMIQLLLATGADINAVDAAGVTPLMLAAAYGNPAAIRVLMERGAEFELRDTKGRNAFDRAYEKGRKDNLNTLVELARKRNRSSGSE